MVGSGAHVYGGVDWVAMGMSASETEDLRNPEVAAYLPSPLMDNPHANVHTPNIYICTLD